VAWKSDEHGYAAHRVKILLLGASGQLGAELRRSLAPLGELTTPSRSDCDLMQPCTVRRCVRVLRPDIIVNAAAWTDVEGAEQAAAQAMAVNGAALTVLAEQARACHALLVHYSSDYVFDGRLGRAYVESDAPNPLSAYGRSKLAGDEAARQADRHLILRAGWLYGLHGDNFLKTLLTLMRQRAQLDVVADQFGTPTSTELLADVTAQVLARYLHAHADARADFAFGTYHVAASGDTHWYGYACQIAEQARAVGWPLRLADDGLRAIDSSAWFSQVLRPRDSRLDTTRLRATFGLRLPPWQDGVQRMVTQLIEGAH